MQAGVVTPEAVRLEFESANLGSRVLATLVDLVVQFTLLLVLAVLGAALADGIGSDLPDWVGIALVVLLGFLVTWGYPVGFETVLRGRTPGKAALGLRVVTQEGAPVRFRHAAIRAALGLVDFYLSLGGVAVVSVLVTARSQRVGDLVAGTLVLRERTATGAVAPVRFAVPPALHWYASSVDPSGITTDDYAAVRGFLLRSATLTPEARGRLGAQMATRLAARVAHTAPPGITPELFLMVLAARFQERSDGARREYSAVAAYSASVAATPPTAAPASAPGDAAERPGPATAPGGGFTPPG